MNTSRGSGPTGPQGDPSAPNQRRPRYQLSGRGWLWVIAAVFLFNLLFYALQFGSSMQSSTPQITLPYSTFISQIDGGNIKTAHISGTDVSGDFKAKYIDSTTHKSYVRYATTLASEVLNNTVTQLDRHGALVTIESQTTPAWVNLVGILLQALPFLFLIGLFYFGTRAARQQQQGVFGFGQSRAKLYTEERPATTFSDVAGVNTAKAELRELVDFLRDPTKYHRLGARIPKGALLVGPPGTGKTLLARAVAGEASVPFISISATEFVELFVGVGASRVRDLFDRAKAVEPSIIFIDEIDAIGGSRGGGRQFGGSNDEREQTLNQLLVSMDGFEPNEAVIVLAATNRPDVLDEALLRPGRFDRQVVVDPPDRQGREAILKIHTRMIPLASDVRLEDLARATPGMSGADLANLANEAALTAARNGHSQVTRHDFDVALDRITLGAEGSALMNEEERKTVAYHEGGHTLVAFMLPNVDPVNRVTITPRGRSLGVTQFLPVDDRRNYRRDYLVNRMAVGMGGRAAEEIAFSDITSGAQNDLQQVTQVARTMVMQLGMADGIAPVYLGPNTADGQVNPFDPRSYSDETAERIDQAVSKLVEDAHQRALAVLKENRETLDAIAEALVRDESLNREQVTAIINRTLPAGRTPLPVPTGEATPTGESEPEVVPPLEEAPRSGTTS